MGFCGDFVCRIGDGCTHRMQVRDSRSCECPECRVVCTGRFPGCGTIWERGPSARATESKADHGLIDFFDPVSEPWLAPPDVGTTAPVVPDRHAVLPAAAAAAVQAVEPAVTDPTATDRRIDELTRALADQVAVTARLAEVVERLETSMTRRWAMFAATDEHLPGIDLRKLLGHHAVLLEGPGAPASAPVSGAGHSHGASTVSSVNGPNHPLT